MKMIRNKGNTSCRSISAKQVATATRIKEVHFKSNWYQLSLKSIFTLVTLRSICFCYFGIKMQQASQQRQAVKVILKSGGRVEYDYQAKSSGQTASPRWLRDLLGDDFFQEVIVVSLDWNGSLGDQQWQQIEVLRKLKKLDLSYISISENRITHLAGLRDLENLSLAGSTMGDFGLEQLSRLRHLRRLDLTNTKITNAKLVRLRRLGEPVALQELHLDNNVLTSLQGLEDFTQLKELSLYGNQITSAHGIGRIRNLEKLNLFGNALTSVKDLQNLTNLKELVLSGNQLSSIEGLEKLYQLESLSLEGNQLTTLQGLEELENLRQLYLSGNRLNSVAALFFLTQLEVIDLGWNPTLPAEQVYKLRSSLPNCKIKWTDPAGVKSAASGHQ